MMTRSFDDCLTLRTEKNSLKEDDLIKKTPLQIPNWHPAKKWTSSLPGNKRTLPFYKDHGCL